MSGFGRIIRSVLPRTTGGHDPAAHFGISATPQPVMGLNRHAFQSALNRESDPALRQRMELGMNYFNRAIYANRTVYSGPKHAARVLGGGGFPPPEIRPVTELEAQQMHLPDGRPLLPEGSYFSLTNPAVIVDPRGLAYSLMFGRTTEGDHPELTVAFGGTSAGPNKSTNTAFRTLANIGPSAQQWFHNGRQQFGTDSPYATAVHDVLERARLVAPQLGEGASVFVTGHSAGGYGQVAMAKMLAADLDAGQAVDPGLGGAPSSAAPPPPMHGVFFGTPGLSFPRATLGTLETEAARQGLSLDAFMSRSMVDITPQGDPIRQTLNLPHGQTLRPPFGAITFDSPKNVSVHNDFDNVALRMAPARATTFAIGTMFDPAMPPTEVIAPAPRTTYLTQPPASFALPPGAGWQPLPPDIAPSPMPTPLPYPAAAPPLLASMAEPVLPPMLAATPVPSAAIATTPPVPGPTSMLVPGGTVLTSPLEEASRL